MADDRIIEWASLLVRAEIRAFDEARRRFVRSASAKRLHDLRRAARKLSSTFEDFRGIIPTQKRKRLKALIELTGCARDAAVLREMLRASLDVRESKLVKPMLRDLRERERDYRNRACDAVKKLRFRT